MGTEPSWQTTAPARVFRGRDAPPAARGGAGSDVDRAKRFYETLGFRMEIDHIAGVDFRVVQVTRPGWEASIVVGNGITAAAST